jgi:hydrogen cyanide synthase HcnC
LTEQATRERNPARGSNREFDTIVVGAGLVGAAIAFGLARAGQRVALLDEGDVAHRASRGNFGLVWVQSKGLGSPHYQRWTRESARAWKDLAHELHECTGIDSALEQPGGLSFCRSEEEFERRAATMRQLQREAGDFGFEFEMLRRDRLAALVPGLGPKVVGASYTPYDGHVNSLRVFRALHQAAMEHGATYLANAAVQTIDPSSAGFSVRSSAGRFSATRLVLAAGLGNRELAPQVGLDCPVAPNKGQILVTEKVGRALTMPTEGIRQTDDGGLLLGSSQEDAGFDEAVTMRTAGAIARRAVDIFPFIAGLRIVRSWAALRVMTPDGLPVYEQSTRYPGAFVATCHSGVTLAAAHALTLAPAIARGELPAAFARFSASRFGDEHTHGKAAAGGDHVPHAA